MRAASLGLIALALAGCVPAGQRRIARDAGVAAGPARVALRTFRATLAAPVGAGAGAPSGAIELQFRDGMHYEYRLVLQDAREVTYVAAWIVRRGTAAPVAVIANDLEVRGAHVQHRGTGSLRGLEDPAELVEELRRDPDGYEVWLRPAAAGAPTLHGVMR